MENEKIKKIMKEIFTTSSYNWDEHTINSTEFIDYVGGVLGKN